MNKMPFDRYYSQMAFLLGFYEGIPTLKHKNMGIQMKTLQKSYSH